ncbi:MAG: DUF309 domain-containing protein [Chloroflexota bacterium]
MTDSSTVKSQLVQPISTVLLWTPNHDPKALYSPAANPRSTPLDKRVLDRSVSSLGGQLRSVESLSAWEEALWQHFPRLLIIDLGVHKSMQPAHSFPDDTTEQRNGENLVFPRHVLKAIQKCNRQAHTRQISIYLLWTVQDADTVFSDMVLGLKDMDALMTHQSFLTQSSTLLKRHLQPAIRYPDGWDSPMTSLLQQAVDEFNRCDYFEQHESFEEAWRSETRPIRQLYQGLLQVGVAFLQIERGNWIGAVKMLRRGLPKLRTLPPICQGIHLEPLRQRAEAIHATLMVLGLERLQELDHRHFLDVRLTPESRSQ